MSAHEIRIDYDRLVDLFIQNLIQLVALRNLMVSKGLVERQEIEHEIDKLKANGIYLALLDKIRER